MALRINTNLGASIVRRSLNVNVRELEERIKRLATGLRINRAADDAAGLSISEGQRAQISGLTQAVRNVELGHQFPPAGRRDPQRGQRNPCPVARAFRTGLFFHPDRREPTTRSGDSKTTEYGRLQEPKG